MKKVINIAHILLTALWPTAFIIIIGYADAYFRTIVLRTFDSSLYLWLMILFALSGLIFAALGLLSKEKCKRKDFLCAHISASIILLFACILDTLPLTGASPVYSSILSFGIWSFLPFVLGFTLFTTVRVVVLYKKQTQ